MKTTSTARRIAATLLTAICLIFIPTAASAQTSAFTYQGKISDGANAATGSYDLQFTLFNAGGTPIGAVQTKEDVSVTGGVFSTTLDFGAAAFDGSERTLQIAVRRGTETGVFTALAPRQAINSTPYAVRALSAATADTATTATTADNLSTTGASNFVGTNDSRLTDSRVPSAGSDFYIQNQNTGIQIADFRINGAGAASIFNATLQYNIGSNRVLSNAGQDTLFVGVGAGAANGSGNGNSFIGANAGRANTTGFSNSFIGGLAGTQNTTGFSNSFVGAAAGLVNSTGNFNSFFGASAGVQNTTGRNNSFVGASAGNRNTTGFANSFFGTSAGQANTVGEQNSFIGTSAGFANTTGSSNFFAGANAGQANTTGFGNSFVGTSAGLFNTTGRDNLFLGREAGLGNTTGGNNTLIGQGANVGSGALTFATALGSGAQVSTSNTIALGRADGSDKVVVYGLGAADTNTALCRNSFNQIATCLTGVTTLGKPENAAAQTTVITALQTQVEAQAKQIAELKAIVCALKTDAEICRVK